jgi:membrane protease YdiL (CAAX protease family)
MSNVPLPVPPPVFLWPPPPPRLPRVWTVFTAFAILIAALFIGSILATLVWIGFGSGLSGIVNPQTLTEQTLSSPGFIMLLMAISVTCSLFAALMGAWLSPVPWKKRLKLVRPRGGIGAIVLLVIAVVSFSHACGIVLSFLPRGGTLQVIGNTLQGQRGFALIQAIFIIGVGAGVGEEFFFRGYCQNRLTQRWGIVPAVLASSAMFGFMHFDIVHSTFAFFLGLYLGWITWKTASIVPAVACHVVNNSASVVEGAFSDPSDDSTSLGTKLGWLIALSFVSFVCAALAMRLVRKYQPPPQPSDPLEVPPAEMMAHLQQPLDLS